VGASASTLFFLMPFTFSSNYKKEDGTTDWSAYNKALLDNGEICYKCRHFILRPVGYQALCFECKELATSSEPVSHHNRIRCPKCGNQTNPSDHEDRCAYEEGDWEIWCTECDHQFIVEVRVEYSYTSPAQISEEKEPDDADVSTEDEMDSTDSGSRPDTHTADGADLVTGTDKPDQD
jgi:DNA-directed RNA polymerase subunit RPC12/RpoP